MKTSLASPIFDHRRKPRPKKIEKKLFFQYYFLFCFRELFKKIVFRRLTCMAARAGYFTRKKLLLFQKISIMITAILENYFLKNILTN